MADENYNLNNQSAGEQQTGTPYTVPAAEPQPPVEEKASVGLAILSYIIPLVGLILFLTKKDNRPKTAKACGICALVSFILNIAISIIMSVAGGAAMFSAIGNEAANTDINSYSEGANSVEADNGVISNDNTVGDYGCVVTSAELCKDWTGNDAVLITYEFTNNSSEAISFDIALDARAYQNGIGLETAILEGDETSLVDVDIKPGITKEVKKAYVLNDTSSDVEIEVSEFFSLTDEKIVTTVQLG